ncbi:hypothetical protein HMPREF9413_0888 [Paenibacillus sp. HGF7]|nr:hypothetical protein HMPREF9413_0888 [Paenibacillus sp. HGF7]
MVQKRQKITHIQNHSHPAAAYERLPFFSPAPAGFDSKL